MVECPATWRHVDPDPRPRSCHDHVHLKELRIRGKATEWFHMVDGTGAKLPNVISGKRGMRRRGAATAAGGKDAFPPHRHFQRN
jgi:hypothetical protein